MKHRFSAAVFGLILAWAAAAADKPAAGGGDTPDGSQAKKEMQARTVTLKDASISLRKALAELAKQTGVTVEDRRGQAEDLNFKIELDGVPFWQALDAIAKEADLRVSVYGDGGKVGLMEGPHRSLAVSYSGPFRIVLKRLVSVRDLESDDPSVCTAYLEIAWEPRFQPLFLEQPKSADLVAQDDKGLALKVLDGGTGRAPVNRKLAVEAQVRFEAPPRSSGKLGLLKGECAFLGPTKMLSFSFDKLAKIENNKQARKQAQEGVSVTLDELSADKDVWTVGFSLDYPAGGPDFESFESWLVNNQVALVRKGESFAPNGGFENESQGGTKAVVKYRFVEGNVEGKELSLKDLADWKLVYKTPGPIKKFPVKFEFKDLLLP